MKKHLPTCFLEGWGITNKGVIVGAFDAGTHLSTVAAEPGL